MKKAIARFNGFLKREDLSIDDAFLMLVIAAGFIATILGCLNLSVATTVSIVSTYVLFAIWCIFDICKSVKDKTIGSWFRKRLPILIPAALAIIVFLIAFFYKNTNFKSFDIYKKLIMSTVLIAIFVLFYDKRFSWKVTKVCRFFSYYVFIILMMIYIQCCFNWHVDFFLRYRNPNSIGTWFLTCFIFFAFGVFDCKKWYFRATHLALAIGSLAMLVASVCRNGEIALLLASFALPLFILIKKKNLKANIFGTILATMPLLFLIAYMTLYYICVDKGIPFQSISISGRQIFWDEVIHVFGESPIFGNYLKLNIVYGYSQMHNSHLDLAANYGIFGLIFACIVFAIFLRKKLNESRSDEIINLAIWGGMVFFLLGNCEVAFFNAIGNGPFIMIGLFCVNCDYLPDFALPKELSIKRGSLGKE